MRSAYFGESIFQRLTAHAAHPGFFCAFLRAPAHVCVCVWTCHVRHMGCAVHAAIAAPSRYIVFSHAWVWRGALSSSSICGFC